MPFSHLWHPDGYNQAQATKFSRLYIAAMFFGLIGAVGGEFAVGFIAATRRDGGLECLWPHS